MGYREGMRWTELVKVIPNCDRIHLGLFSRMDTEGQGRGRDMSNKERALRIILAPSNETNA